MVNNQAANARYKKAGTLVLWDIENNPIPKGCNCKPEGIAQKIRSALHKLNYLGQISIRAYGNMDEIPPSVKQALSSTGISLHQIDSRILSLYLFSEVWMCPYPAPANLMFISRDHHFPSHAKYFVEWGHNILLAHPPHPSDSMVASAKTRWLWKSLLEEPDITSQTLTPC